jgi:hypothetical protein
MRSSVTDQGLAKDAEQENGGSVFGSPVSDPEFEDLEISQSALLGERIGDFALASGAPPL